MANLVDVDRYVAERNAAFESDDLDWARRALSEIDGQMALEIVFHKTRYHCPDVSLQKRMESQRWLALHNFADMHGRDVVDGDPLPQD